MIQASPKDPTTLWLIFLFSLLQSTQSVFSKDARSTLFYYVAMFAGDKTIPAGQELTYDYGESHASELIPVRNVWM